MKNVSLIVAVSKNQVIGRNNKLAWNLPNDMKYFSDMTKGHSVIMGRKIGVYTSNFRPLPKRKNIIITRNSDYKANNAIIVSSIEEAIKSSRSNSDDEVL